MPAPTRIVSPSSTYLLVSAGSTIVGDGSSGPMSGASSGSGSLAGAADGAAATHLPPENTVPSPQYDMETSAMQVSTCSSVPSPHRMDAMHMPSTTSSSHETMSAMHMPSTGVVPGPQAPPSMAPSILASDAVFCAVAAPMSAISADMPVSVSVMPSRTGSRSAISPSRSRMSSSTAFTLRCIAFMSRAVPLVASSIVRSSSVFVCAYAGAAAATMMANRTPAAIFLITAWQAGDGFCITSKFMRPAACVSAPSGRGRSLGTGHLETYTRIWRPPPIPSARPGNARDGARCRRMPVTSNTLGSAPQGARTPGAAKPSAVLDRFWGQDLRF